MDGDARARRRRRAGRWCTAATCVDRTPLALDLASRRSHLDGLASRVDDVGRRLAFRVEQLAPLGGRPDDAGRAVDSTRSRRSSPTCRRCSTSSACDSSGRSSSSAPRAGVRGSATPRAQAHRPRDGSPPARSSSGRRPSTTRRSSETDLERAAASGSSLLHVNGRWIRLDERQVRTTLARLQQHREEHAELDVGGLIQLAAENADPLTRVEGEQWVGELLAGLPDDRLTETHEPPEFVGELRHYQRRGLSWMSFLARLGLGGCLADDMGLGKTATALAHLATPSRQAAPRRVPVERRPQLVRRGGPLHAGPAGRDPPRRRAGAWRSTRRRSSSRPTSSSPRTACSRATSTRSPPSSGARSSSTRRRW